MEPNKIFILNTLVGSHAHGLVLKENTDRDYRGVYVIPTKDLLSLNFDGKKVLWEEGERDQTAYEIGHFLTLALNNVPNALEVLVAPREDLDNSEDEWRGDDFGYQLRLLFSDLYHPDLAYKSFINYAHNNRKKMIEDHLGRSAKYGCQYIRTLINLNHLLREGTFSLEVGDYAFRIKLLQIKKGEISVGRVLDYGRELEADALAKLRTHLDNLPLVNLKRQEKVNEFLLKIRREYWDG